MAKAKRDPKGASPMPASLDGHCTVCGVKDSKRKGNSLKSLVHCNRTHMACSYCAMILWES